MLSGKDIRDWLDCGAIMSCGHGRVLLGWGKRQWMNIPSPAVQKEVFFFPDFFLHNPNPWFEQESHREVEIEELRSLLIRHDVIRYNWESSCRKLFNEAFDDLKKKLSSGTMHKAVPWVFESTAELMTKRQLCSSLSNIIEVAQHHPLYSYGFWGDEGGMLGMTPELLFRYDCHDLLETMACAGTMPARAGSSLLQNPKELHEHNLVVQGICESFAPLGTIAVGPIGLLALPHIVHLVTPISVSMREKPDFDKIVKMLHPTPALGGAPKIAAMEWLKQFQKKADRMRFGAPAGYLRLQDNVGVCYVAIRNAQWNQHGIFVGAGCGIVAGSNCEREWDELKLKLQATKELLAL